MGKSSRKKRQSVDENIFKSVELAAEMILHPNVINTYLSYSLFSKKPDQNLLNTMEGVANALNFPEFKNIGKDMDAVHKTLQNTMAIEPGEWALRFVKAFRNKWFLSFTQNIINNAHGSIWNKDPKEALMFGGNRTPPDEAPQLIAYKRARTMLLSSKQNPLWLELVIGALSRLVAVNAKGSFNSNEWSEVSLFWMDLEKNFIRGDGIKVATMLFTAECDFFDKKLDEFITSNLSHALAELAINTYDTPFFA